MENSQQGAFATSTQLNDEQIFQQGLTKREYFAGLAMQGMLSNPQFCGDREIMMIRAVKIANALLKELDNIK